MLESLPIFAATDLDDVVACAERGPRTLADLLTDAARLAACLPEAPAAGRDALVTCAGRYAFAAALLAAWHRGFRVVLPPNLRPGTLRELAAGAAAWLGDAGAGLVVDETLEGAAEGAPRLDPPRAPAARELVVVHTSGSTGASRGASKTAGQLLGEAHALAGAFDLASVGGPVLATVPAHHIYGLLFGVLMPLVAGLPMVDAAPLHAETVAAVARAHGVRVLVSTPAHLRGLELLEPGGLPSVARVFSSGAALPAATAAMMSRHLGLEVTEILGSTETGGIAWRESVGGAPPERWRPLPGVEVAADADGRMLLARSDFLPPGAARPHPCDDRIEVRSDGTFAHLGRVDDVVKIGGKRLSLGDMQRRLLEIPGIEDAGVIAEPAADGRGVVVRAAVVAPGREAGEVRAALLEHFDPTVVPRRILKVERLPRAATGKLPRAALAALFAAGPASDLERGTLEREAPDRARLRARVPRGLRDLEGHFPHDPILPGVSQLTRLVVPGARAAWPELGPLREIQRLKFRARVGPGDELELRLDRAATGRVRFEVRKADTPCTSGVLLFGE